MAYLGEFREGFENIIFRIKGPEPLNPVTLAVEVTDAGGRVQDVPFLPAADTDLIAGNEFDGVWITSARRLGEIQIKASAESPAGYKYSSDKKALLISSYGRNYGFDYGHGL